MNVIHIAIGKRTSVLQNNLFAFTILIMIIIYHNDRIICVDKGGYSTIATIVI